MLHTERMTILRLTVEDRLQACGEMVASSPMNASDPARYMRARELHNNAEKLARTVRYN